MHPTSLLEDIINWKKRKKAEEEGNCNQAEITRWKDKITQGKEEVEERQKLAIITHQIVGELRIELNIPNPTKRKKRSMKERSNNKILTKSPQSVSKYIFLHGHFNDTRFIARAC